MGGRIIKTFFYLKPSITLILSSLFFTFVFVGCSPSSLNSSRNRITLLLKLSPASATIDHNTNQDITASGGVPPYSFQIESGPGELLLSESVVRYVAPLNTSGLAVIKVTDSTGKMERSSLTILGPLTLAPLSLFLSPGRSQSFTATGGTGLYTFSIVPEVGGLTISPTGLLSAANVPVNTRASVTVRVTDGPRSAMSTVNIAPPLSVSPTPINLKQSQTQTFTPSGGMPPYSYTSTTGTLSATTGATTTFTAPPVIPTATTQSLTVIDSINNRSIATINLKKPVEIAPAISALGPGMTAQFTATGGDGVYIFSISGDPAGSTITVNGLLTTPSTVSASLQITVRVTDGLLQIADSAVNIAPPLSVSPTSIDLKQSQTQAFTPSGGMPPYSYTSTIGTLSATTGATTTFTAPPVIPTATTQSLTVRDNKMRSLSVNLSLWPPVQISVGTISILQGTDHIFSAMGGKLPYTYSIVLASMNGLATINSASGLLITPTILTSRLTLTIRVTDILGQISDSIATVDPAFSINPGTVDLTNSSPRVIFTPTGGSGVYTYLLTPDTSQSGTISLFAGNNTTYTKPSNISIPRSISLTVTDNLLRTRNSTINLFPPVIINERNVSLKQNSTFSFASQGGKTPYSYSIMGGANGCTINSSTGVFQTPSIVASRATVTVRVTDSLGQTNDSSVQIFTSLMLAFQEKTMDFNTTYSLIPLGGKAPYSFFAVNSSSAATVDTNGLIRSSINTPGIVIFRVTDAISQTTDIRIIVELPLNLTPAIASLIRSERLALDYSGGVPPYTFLLEPNLGVISPQGLFTAPANASGDIRVTITDSLGAHGFSNITILTPVSLANRVVAPSSNTQLVASGGAAPYTYSIQTGGGTISGATFQAGSTSGVTEIKVTDFRQQQWIAIYNIQPPVTLNPISLELLHGASGVVTAQGGNGTYTFSLISQSANVGTLTPTTPSTNPVATFAASNNIIANTNNISIRVVDGLGQADDTTVTIYAPITIAPLNELIAKGKTRTFVASQGKLPYKYSTITNNSVGTISSTSGIFTAKNSASGGTTVSVTDRLGQMASTTLSVASPLSFISPKISYKQQETGTFSAAGGDGIYQFSIIGPGTINPTTGAFIAANVATITTSRVKVADGLGQLAEVVISTYPLVSITPLTKILAKNQTVILTSSLGKPPYTFLISPNMGSLSVASGTGPVTYTAPDSVPTATTVTFTVTDALSQTGTALINLKPDVILSPITSPVKGGSTQTLIASGGNEVFTFSILSGSSGGALSSLTPASPNQKIFTATNNLPSNISVVVQVKDGLNQTASRTIMVVAPVDLSPAIPSAMLPGTSQVFTASKGATPYTFSLSTASTGILTAVANAPNQQTYTAPSAVATNIQIDLTVTDNLGQIKNKIFTVAGPITFPFSRYSVVKGTTRVVDPQGGIPNYRFANPSSGGIAFVNGHWLFNAPSSPGRVLLNVTDSINQSKQIPVDVLPKILPRPPLPFNNPTSITIDSNGNEYVVDSFNDRIVKFSPFGTLITTFGGASTLDTPWSIAVSPSGDFYISEYRTHRIAIFNSNFEYQGTFGSEGTNDGQLKFPQGIALDSSGNIYVADTGNNRIQKFSARTATAMPQFIMKFGIQGNLPGQFNSPSSVFIDPNNAIYVCDDTRLQKVIFPSPPLLPSISLIGTPGSTYIKPSASLLGDNGFIYILDEASDKIIKFNPSENTSSSFGTSGQPASGQTAYGKFLRPKAFYRDAFGQFYVVDTANNRVQIFNSNF